MAIGDQQGPDINSMMRQHAAATGGGGGGGEKEHFEKIADGFASLLTKFLGLLQLGGIGSTGLFRQLESKGYLSSMINSGAPAMNLRGGAGTKFVMESLRIATLNNFEKLAKPAIESPEIGGGFHVVDMSLASLGTLTPSSGGGGGRGMQIG